MMFKNVLLLGTSLAMCLLAQAQNFCWAKRTGGSCAGNPYGYTESGDQILRDTLGNIYVRGSFHDTSDFDPGPGINQLVNTSVVFGEAFFAKYDSTGNLIWVQEMGESGPAKMAIDKFGNKYFAGMLIGTADLQPGPGVYNFTASGSYLVKYNASDNVVWAKPYPSPVLGLAADSYGSIFVAGIGNGIDVDLGPGTALITPTFPSTFSLFFARYNAAGDYSLSKRIDVSEGGCEWACPEFKLMDFQLDDSNNILLLIQSDDIQFQANPSPSTSAVYYNYSNYLLKYNPAGALLWLKDKHGVALAADNLGNVLVSSSGVSKYTPGGTLLWNAGPSLVATTSITTDDSCDVLVGGYTSQDAGFSKIDSGGTWLWTKYISSGNSSSGFETDKLNSIVSDENGNQYVAGYFNQGTGDFDPSFPGTANLSCKGVRDIFFAKYSNGAGTNTAGWMDIGITSVSGSNPVFCEDSVTIVAQMKNYSGTTLDSAIINYILGGVSYSYSWSGSLLPSATVSVNLPAVPIQQGFNSLKVFSSAPNGTSDVNPDNDLLETYRIGMNSLATLPVVEGFESSSFPPAGWTIDNIYNPAAATTGITGTWLHHTTAGGFGNSSNSANIYFYNYSDCSQEDELYSPPFDLSSGASAALDFSVAYKQYPSNSNDLLNIQASIDCGATWNTVYSKSGLALSTTSYDGLPFTSPSPADWRSETVDLSPFTGQPLVLLKFHTKSLCGDNLYLDDINIHQSMVSISENNVSSLALLYPQPMGSTAILEVTDGLLKDKHLVLEIYSLQGEKIKDFRISDTKTRISRAGMAAGMYFYILSGKNVVYKKDKFIVD
jgi:hypothetical protein